MSQLVPYVSLNTRHDLVRVVRLARMYRLSIEEFRRFIALMMSPPRSLFDKPATRMQLVQAALIISPIVSYVDFLQGQVDTHTAAALSTFEPLTRISEALFMLRRAEMKTLGFYDSYSWPASRLQTYVQWSLRQFGVRP